MIEKRVAMNLIALTLLIALGIVILLAVCGAVLYRVNRDLFNKIKEFFVIDKGELDVELSTLKTVKPVKKKIQKSSNESKVDMVKLVSKCDDRMRTVDSLGVERITDAYYELTFINRKQEQIVITCSEDAYKGIPFEVLGSLTYKRNVLVRFRYFDNSNEYIVNN